MLWPSLFTLLALQSVHTIWELIISGSAPVSRAVHTLFHNFLHRILAIWAPDPKSGPVMSNECSCSNNSSLQCNNLPLRLVKTSKIGLSQTSHPYKIFSSNLQMCVQASWKFIKPDNILNFKGHEPHTGYSDNPQPYKNLTKSSCWAKVTSSLRCCPSGCRVGQAYPALRSLIRVIQSHLDLENGPSYRIGGKACCLEQLFVLTAENQITQAQLLLLLLLLMTMMMRGRRRQRRSTAAWCVQADDLHREHENKHFSRTVLISHRWNYLKAAHLLKDHNVWKVKSRNKAQKARKMFFSQILQISFDLCKSHVKLTDIQGITYYLSSGKI